jgi:hypothetical protein
MPSTLRFKRCSAGCVPNLHHRPTPCAHFRRDDGANFLGNDYIQSVNVTSVEWIFRDGTLIGVYEPFALLFKALVVRCMARPDPMSGMSEVPSSPRPFIAAALMLHALTAIMAYGWALDLIAFQAAKTPSKSPALRTKAIVAAVVVAIFGVHPLRTEVIMWASATPYALSGFFCLLCARCHVRSLVRPGRESGHSLAIYAWRALSAAAYGCAVLSKSAAVPLPAALWGIDVILARSADVRGPTDFVWSLVASFGSTAHTPLFALAALGIRTAMVSTGPSENAARKVDYGGLHALVMRGTIVRRA